MVIFLMFVEYTYKMGFFTDKLIEISGVKNMKKYLINYLEKLIFIINMVTQQIYKKQIGTEISIEKTLEDLLKYWLDKIN